jgi:hypothetical protein
MWYIMHYYFDNDNLQWFWLWLIILFKGGDVTHSYWNSKRKLRGCLVPTETLKNTERTMFLLKWERVEWPTSGLTATRVGQTANLYNWGGLTASLCITHSLAVWEAGQTSNTSNSQIFNLKVVIAIVSVRPWNRLWSDRHVRRNFSTARFWSVGYKYSSISYKISLLTISTTYLTLERSLPSHTSLSWSIMDVWDSSVWFEWGWALWH